MQQYLFIILASLFVTACPASMYAKTFTVIADPPDSIIRVISGPDHKEQKFSSPAVIAADVATESARASKEILEVSKDRYKPVTIVLRHINEGDTIRVKLEKAFLHQLTYRLLAPAISSELDSRKPIPSRNLIFRDKAISISVAIGETSFQVGLKNLSEHPLKILWERGGYSDIHTQRFRLMNSGVRYQDRNNPIPDQIVLPGESIQETITPIEHVFVSSKTGKYEVKPLFGQEEVSTSGLRGKTFNLFIPIEINRAITPYNFKIQIMSDER